MTAEQLEKWINHNEDLAAEFSNGDYVISSYKIRALFAGKVLVPVEPTEAMLKAMQMAPQDMKPMPWPVDNTIGGRIVDELRYKSMLAASQEQGK
jgi:hypothetical protein